MSRVRRAGVVLAVLATTTLAVLAATTQAVLAATPPASGTTGPRQRGVAADLVIEAELMPEKVYVGGEARLLLRLLRAPGVTHGTLLPPALGDAADLSLLGPINTYQIERAGITYEVLERTHVIVPRRAGRLVLPGAEFEGALRYAEVFSRDAGAAAAAPRSARGPQRVLDVLPPPPGSADPWLPARRLTLEETWSGDLSTLSAGAPITRTLILRAEGIPAERLPRLEMAAHPALMLHHDQPELTTDYLAEGVVGTRAQRIMLIPATAGEVTLPALDVRWWDVGAEASRTASIAGRTLRLQTAQAPGAAQRGPAAGVSAPTLVRWGLVAFAALVGFAVWWHQRTRLQRAARNWLRTACLRDDAHAARDALLDWAKAARPAAPPQLVRQVGAAWPDPAARAELDGLDAAIYGRGAWDGAAFWRRVRPWLRIRALRDAAPERASSFAPRALRAPPSLPAPLFRLHARDMAGTHRRSRRRAA